MFYVLLYKRDGYAVEDDLVEIFFDFDSLVDGIDVVIVIEWFFQTLELGDERITAMRFKLLLLSHSIDLLAEERVLFQDLIQTIFTEMDVVGNCFFDTFYFFGFDLLYFRERDIELIDHFSDGLIELA